MKLLPLPFCILGMAVLACGNKGQGVEDAKAIQALIAEYKAIGAPTNGSEGFHKIPDSENSELELKPMLIGRVSQELRSQGIVAPGTYLSATVTKADLPRLKRYLEYFRSYRESVVKPLEAKPKYQWTHDPDIPGASFDIEPVSLFCVAQDYCVEAAVASLEEDDKLFMRDLQIATRIAGTLNAQGKWIATRLANDLRTLIMVTALRSIETRPISYKPLKDYLDTKDRFGKPPFELIFQNELLNQIALARHFDLPNWDEPEVANSENIRPYGKVQHGDYIPQYPKMRKYMRNRLEAWKPVFVGIHQKGSSAYEPTLDDIRVASATYPQNILPKPLMYYFDGDLLPQGDASLIYKQYDAGYAAIWRAIEIKNQTGHYPKTLKEIGLSDEHKTSLDNINYSATENGITLTSAEQTGAERAPRFRISFPPSLVQSKEEKEYARKFREGEIGFKEKQ